MRNSVARMHRSIALSRRISTKENTNNLCCRQVSSSYDGIAVRKMHACCSPSSAQLNPLQFQVRAYISHSTLSLSPPFHLLLFVPYYIELCSCTKCDTKKARNPSLSLQHSFPLSRPRMIFKVITNLEALIKITIQHDVLCQCICVGIFYLFENMLALQPANHLWNKIDEIANRKWFEFSAQQKNTTNQRI